MSLFAVKTDSANVSRGPKYADSVVCFSDDRINAAAAAAVISNWPDRPAVSVTATCRHPLSVGPFHKQNAKRNWNSNSDRLGLAQVRRSFTVKIYSCTEHQPNPRYPVSPTPSSSGCNKTVAPRHFAMRLDTDQRVPCQTPAGRMAQTESKGRTDEPWQRARHQNAAVDELYTDRRESAVGTRDSDWLPAGNNGRVKCIETKTMSELFWCNYYRLAGVLVLEGCFQGSN